MTRVNNPSRGAEDQDVPGEFSLEIPDPFGDVLDSMTPSSVTNVDTTTLPM